MDQKIGLSDKTGEILKKPLFNSETFKFASIAELEAMRDRYKAQIQRESADASQNDPENQNLILGLLGDLKVIEDEIKKRMH